MIRVGRDHRHIIILADPHNLAGHALAEIGFDLNVSRVGNDMRGRQDQPMSDMNAGAMTVALFDLDRGACPFVLAHDQRGRHVGAEDKHDAENCHCCTQAKEPSTRRCAPLRTWFHG